MPIQTKPAGELDDDDIGLMITWSGQILDGPPEQVTIRLGRVQHYGPSGEFVEGMTQVQPEGSTEVSYALNPNLAVDVDDEIARYSRVFFDGRPGSVLYVDGHLWSGVIDDDLTQSQIEKLLGVRRYVADASASLPSLPTDLTDLALRPSESRTEGDE